jgi:hypothetical protein
MATHRSGHRPAGGLHSKQTVHKQAPKLEPKPHSIDPKAVSHLGESQFLGRLPLRDGKGYSPPQGPTDNVAAVGVGGGRKVYASGSQGQHGQSDRGMPGMPSTRGEWPDDPGK